MNYFFIRDNRYSVRYERWKVIIEVILFLAVMGIVGKFDCDYQMLVRP